MEMNRLRFLGNYIPEFGKIVCMVQHDAYHVYTVDVHSIFMVREIRESPELQIRKRASAPYEDGGVPRKQARPLPACLFHDMGKGEGKGTPKRERR